MKPLKLTQRNCRTGVNPLEIILVLRIPYTQIPSWLYQLSSTSAEPMRRRGGYSEGWGKAGRSHGRDRYYTLAVSIGNIETRAQVWED